MKYENRKTGKIATLDQMNEKFKTVLLVFEDGTNTTISTSTLKRWWKEIPEEETKEQESKQEASKYAEASAAITKELNKNNSKSLVEMVEAQADEDVAGDGTPLAEVGKEIAKQAKEKSKKVRKETKSETDRQVEASAETEKLVQFIIDEAQKIKASPYYREKQPNIINFKLDGAATVSFNIIRSKKSGVCLNTKSKLISSEIAGKMKAVNHCFDRSYKIVELNDSEIVFIREVLQSIGNCAVKKPIITKDNKKAKKGDD